MESIEEYTEAYLYNRLNKNIRATADIREDAKKMNIEDSRIDDFLILLDALWGIYEQEMMAKYQGKKMRMVGIAGIVVFPIAMSILYFNATKSLNTLIIPFGLIAMSILLFLLANQKIGKSLEMARRRELLINTFLNRKE